MNAISSTAKPITTLTRLSSIAISFNAVLSHPAGHPDADRCRDA
nr:hypothetical protein [Burkholderia ambifaria]